MMSSATINGQTIYISEARIQVAGQEDCGAKELDDSEWKVVALRKLPRQQVFCLRSSVLIDPSTLSETTSLSLSLLAASEIYWDGRLLGKNGKVGMTKDSEKPGDIDVLFPIGNELLTMGDHQLAIRASTFFIDDEYSPVFLGLRVIDTHSVHQFLMRSSWLATFVMGGLLVIAILFQLFFWVYQRRAHTQVFSLLCLSAAFLLLAEKWRAMFGYTYDFHQQRMYLVMSFTYALCLLLPGFYLSYYDVRRKAMLLALAAFLLSCSVLLIDEYDSRSIAMFLTALLLSLSINLYAMRLKKLGAKLNSLFMLGALVVFVSAPTDFTEDRFSITLFTIVLVMLSTIIREMKHNRMQSLASIRLEAQLLKRNLQPHFLMNSLMLVIEWIEQKPDAAASFVQALAEELRMLVKFSDLSSVLLSEEILLCERHLEIMAYRYNMNFSLDVQGDVTGLSIPPAIIHTQIENCFSHNDVPADSTFELLINRNAKDIELVLTTPYDKRTKENGLGIGERYILSRLSEKFGEEFTYQSFAVGASWTNKIRFKAQG
ncbi:MAG: sensor histidine kinase YesM [Candidatus Azotimanducaceae bacterium]|jgi:sensor histidine kinase YesM